MVSATNYRYVNATPLKAFAQYFFLRKSDLQPYAGLGIGAMYVTAHTRIATLDAWYSQWGLLIAPEVGLLYRLSNRFGVNVAVAYHISSNSFDIGQTAIQSLQSAMLNIGVSCLL
jgi:outer membrane protein W